MKILIMIFPFLLMPFWALAQEQGELAGNLEGSRTKAISIMAEAFKNTSSPKLKAIYQKMMIQLSMIQLEIPQKGKDFPLCVNNDRLAYFTPKFSTSIFICERLLEEKSLVKAQTLIHESAHAIGYYNECQATIFEISAMQLAGLDLAFPSYSKSCGF